MYELCRESGKFLIFVAKRHHFKLITGVPAALRTSVWQALLGVESRTMDLEDKSVQASLQQSDCAVQWRAHQTRLHRLLYHRSSLKI